jgi:hypothetical protein
MPSPFLSSWKYLEYPEFNIEGSYLYEPAGSTHSLVVPESNTQPTEVIFVIHGSTLTLDHGGNVVGVTDAWSLSKAYLSRCEELGLPRPAIIGL